MIETFKKVVFENYANFSGRARRREYWMFCLANIVLSLVLGIVLGILTAVTGVQEVSYLSYIVSLALLCPGIAVGVRRLHDVGKSGLWYLTGLIPVVNFVMAIVLLVWFCTDGEEGPNKYGPNPKTGATFKDANSLEFTEGDKSLNV